MKHVTFGEKSLLVGDGTADLLLAYAAALARHKSADTVDVHAVSSDGDETVATFLLNEGTTFMAESTHSSWPEPDNADADAYLTEHTRILDSPPPASSAASHRDADFEAAISDLEANFEQSPE